MIQIYLLLSIAIGFAAGGDLTGGYINGFDSEVACVSLKNASYHIIKLCCLYPRTVDIPPPPPNCPGDKVHTDCASSCQNSCEVQHDGCTLQCDPHKHCVCPPGTVEITTGSDKCVEPLKCPEQPTCSNLIPERRTDCGGGLGKEKCEAKGCCWDSSITGVNWCFYKDMCIYTDPLNRVDCGGGLGKANCEAKGCCWDNSILGVIWCFHETDIPPPPPKCTGDKVHTDCASSCQDSCEVQHDGCTLQCDPHKHCVCPPGTVELTSGSDKCVVLSKCPDIPPPPPKCPGDKVHTDCASSCQDSCEVQHDGCTLQCDPHKHCVCPSGTVEITTGSDKCVVLTNCPDQPTCSNLLPERRRDCGRRLGKGKCEAKGCCWDRSISGVKWCFYKDMCIYTNPKNRVDCGGGLGKAECEAKGCCWDNSFTGVNWCFHKSDVPSPPLKCPGDKVYTKCASSCQDSCLVQHSLCTLECNPFKNCVCPKGTVERKPGSKECIKLSDCPGVCNYKEPSARIDCGASSNRKCKAKGCCWDNNIYNLNRCFHKTTVPKRCPPVDPAEPVCVEGCRKSTDCKNGQSCCSTGCGHRCMNNYFGG
uniref:integumentary mucin C.1-like n=1 Tax=Styela clava TaxID=7725 RepID=UPI00193A5020|nr:integumentary mucin C.1-like [Styela clava]